MASNFNKHFEIKFANTQELKNKVFKIRYNVYCSELGWEPENNKGIETDKYDESALHCLLVHKRTGDLAGCVRLIVPKKDTPDFKLPFENIVLSQKHSDNIGSQKLEERSFCEVSRLAVLNKFRRTEKSIPLPLNEAPVTTIYTEEERNNFPNIAMGLYLAALSLAEINNHAAVFVMMEPRLNRRLQHFGFPFKQVSSVIDFHGKRAMFMLEKAHLTSQLTPEIMSLYRVIDHDLRKQINNSI